LNQARNVGEHEFAAVGVDNAELRMERGERVVGDFRLGGADRAEKGRLARIRQADNAGIGNELEPQPDCQFDARLTGIGGARWAGVWNGALPKPPLPPRASTTCCPISVRSANSVSPSAS